MNKKELEKNSLPPVSNRLKTVADMVPEGSKIADVGTDHGFVPIYLALSHRIEHAIAMDVRKGPLERATLHVEEYGLNDMIETRLSDGLEKLKEGHASLLSEKFKSGSDITLEDILDAAHEEDVLAIEAIEEVGTNLGRAIAGLINIFNPELVIIGGCVSSAQDYILLPIKSAVQKHSLSLINRDTKIKISKLGEKAGAIGACMLSRSKLLGLL
jgi:hypothetical protein